jgi:hypothetical protein
MKKLATVFLAFAFVMICANQQLAQSKCALTEANSPNVGGLRLGMTAQQLLAMFPGASKRREMKDEIDRAKAGGGETVYLTFDPATDSSKSEFAGVSSISAGLSRGKVVDLIVGYMGTTWTNVDAWIAKLGEMYRLPGQQSWVEGPSENPNKVLRCDGIEIEASIQGGGSSIRIRTR